MLMNVISSGFVRASTLVQRTQSDPSGLALDGGQDNRHAQVESHGFIHGSSTKSRDDFIDPYAIQSHGNTHRSATQSRDGFIDPHAIQSHGNTHRSATQSRNDFINPHAIQSHGNTNSHVS